MRFIFVSRIVSVGLEIDIFPRRLFSSSAYLQIVLLHTETLRDCVPLRLHQAPHRARGSELAVIGFDLMQ